MITCLIPARGGSKSLPLKNIIKINGKPLIWWVLNAAQNSKIDNIYVPTDSSIIKQTIEAFNFSKVKVINRSSESSSDNASTEMVMKEFYDKKKDFDYLCLIQATSPLLNSNHINGAIKQFFKSKSDSLLTLINHKNFTWSLIAQKKLTKFLDLNLNYLGRKTETSNTIHTGNIQLRAYF